MAPKAAAAVQDSYNSGDLVLGRIKGFPWWPGKIIDPEKEPHLRPAVLEGKPGKKTAFLVRYYDDGDYSWLEPKDLKPLSITDIETFVGKGQKPSALKKAYQTAHHPEEWEKQHMITLANRASRGDADEIDEEKEQPPKKKQRKSAPAEPKAAKPKAAAAAKKDTESKAKKDDKKKPAAAEGAEPEVEKLCRGWRSRLQRAFLGGKETPKPEDLPALDEVFVAMEAWDPDQAGLEPSKLPKVLKRIPLVEYDIPNEAKYRFKERSVALLNKWSQVLGGGEIAAATPVPASATTAEEKSSHISPDPPAAAVAAAAEEEATNGDTTVLTDVGDVSMAVNGAEADTKPAEEAAAAAAPAPAV